MFIKDNYKERYYVRSQSTLNFGFACICVLCTRVLAGGRVYECVYADVCSCMCASARTHVLALAPVCMRACERACPHVPGVTANEQKIATHCVQRCMSALGTFEQLRKI